MLKPVYINVKKLVVLKEKAKRYGQKGKVNKDWGKPPVTAYEVYNSNFRGRSSGYEGVISIQGIKGRGLESSISLAHRNASDKIRIFMRGRENEMSEISRAVTDLRRGVAETNRCWAQVTVVWGKDIHF